VGRAKRRAAAGRPLHQTIRSLDGGLARLESILDSAPDLPPNAAQRLTELVQRFQRVTADIQARAERAACASVDQPDGASSLAMSAFPSPVSAHAAQMVVPLET
jgi:hypothetical protein